MTNFSPFPVDDATLDLLMAAVDPWANGHPEAEQSTLMPFLDMMSNLSGSDTTAVQETISENVHVMRDPQYSTNCVIIALVERSAG